MALLTLALHILHRDRTPQSPDLGAVPLDGLDLFARAKGELHIILGEDGGDIEKIEDRLCKQPGLRLLTSASTDMGADEEVRRVWLRRESGATQVWKQGEPGSPWTRSPDGAALTLERLLQESPPNPKGDSLLVKGVDDLGEDAVEVLATLRRLVDLDQIPQSRSVFLVGEDPRSFSTGPFSSLLDQATTWRVAHQSQADLAMDWGADLAPLVLQLTGGQRLLAESLLTRVRDRKPGATIRGASAALVEEECDALIAAPPSAVRHWQRALAHALGDGSRTRRLLTDLVRGDRFARFPADALPLFIAGWIMRCRPEEGLLRWAMPRMHQTWARQVLDSPNRFGAPRVR